MNYITKTNMILFSLIASALLQAEGISKIGSAVPVPAVVECAAPQRPIVAVYAPEITCYLTRYNGEGDAVVEVERLVAGIDVEPLMKIFVGEGAVRACYTYARENRELILKTARENCIRGPWNSELRKYTTLEVDKVEVVISNRECRAGLGNLVP